MPNYCQNSATFTHQDPEQIKKIVQAIENKELFNTFVPTPDELENQLAYCYGGDKANEQDTIRTELYTKYGYENGNEWRTGEWGTKWDADDIYISDETDNTITIEFDTAWSPPIAFYEKIETLGYEIQAYYYEGGCCFAGEYNSELGHAEYTWDDLKSAKQNIPDHIDQEFNIFENMEEYEEEQEEIQRRDEKHGLYPDKDDIAN